MPDKTATSEAAQTLKADPSRLSSETAGAEPEDVRRLLIETETAFRALEKDHRDLDELRQKTLAESEKHKAVAEALEIEHSQADETIKQLSAQLQTRYEELAKLGRLVAALEERNAFERAENAAALEAKRDALTGMTKQLQDYEKTVKKAQDRVAHLAAEKDRLARQVSDMRKSTSWRITGPLRRLVRLLRR